ncbi:MAG: D-tyrosyl-tRNA(Tyr) deacylase, partial [Gammaproteobacteria bacterium]|nr:D-tyrosyl-tRNA(Tyr) deacylase [Gammaproteobacteria bacterium]
MKALIQRVDCAQVDVVDVCVGRIKRGLLVFLACEPHDSEALAERLIDRVLAYRVFPDAAGRMNLGLLEAGGEVLMVPQFTLAADTRKGLRPSFSTAAAPVLAERLFAYAVGVARQRYTQVGRSDGVQ